jgi:hypothetical protein
MGRRQGNWAEGCAINELPRFWSSRPYQDQAWACLRQLSDIRRPQITRSQIGSCPEVEVWLSPVNSEVRIKLQT